MHGQRTNDPWKSIFLVTDSDTEVTIWVKTLLGLDEAKVSLDPGPARVTARHARTSATVGTAVTADTLVMAGTSVTPSSCSCCQCCVLVIWPGVSVLLQSQYV